MKALLLSAAMMIGVAVPAQGAPKPPASKPSPAQPARTREIAKGMTLREAESIAGYRAKLERRDDEGNAFYTLNVIDRSAADEEIQNRYSLTAATA